MSTYISFQTPTSDSFTICCLEVTKTGDNFPLDSELNNNPVHAPFLDGDRLEGTKVTCAGRKKLTQFLFITLYNNKGPEIVPLNMEVSLLWISM